jgi:archaellum component FlaF (FlaF/FlaG flagellin family)
MIQKKLLLHHQQVMVLFENQQDLLVSLEIVYIRYEIYFNLVDASRAGEGNLEISVNYSGRNIPNQVNPIGNSRFEVQFTPQEATVHYCNILFNGEVVPGK